MAIHLEDRIQIISMKQEINHGLSTIQVLTTLAILVVVGAFLVSILHPYERYQKYLDMKRAEDLNYMQQVLAKFYQDNGMYPAGSGAPGYIMTGLDGINVSWGQSFRPYSEKLPEDPGGKRYVYFVSSDKQAYWIYASLSDVGIGLCNGGMACENLKRLNIAYDACGGICNYGVSSPNATP